MDDSLIENSIWHMWWLNVNYLILMIDVLMQSLTSRYATHTLVLVYTIIMIKKLNSNQNSIDTSSTGRDIYYMMHIMWLVINATRWFCTLTLPERTFRLSDSKNICQY